MGPQRLRKTRNRTRDLDQISTDLKHPARLQQHLSTLPLDDLPALGQHYCTPCAKFLESLHALGQHYCTPCAKFLESLHALAHHQRSKAHKKRVKLLKEPEYTHAEANAAVGRGTDNGRFTVRPEDVINGVNRERILLNGGLKGGAMEVDLATPQNEPAPQLVHAEEEEDPDL
ncbi:Bud site selection protein 20 [Orbilia brochopaga]|uniref:Bud site selection protein 20 n=1 Tax=Orbilia brochopaga TaxID=3140254 RepID=A0AAV9UYR0_9PEZI